jgi:hypothetical protein
MIYLIIKAALSGFIVMAVSEVARRGPGFGGLIASLPLVSILAMIWLWQDTADTGDLLVRPAVAADVLGHSGNAPARAGILAHPRPFLPSDHGPLFPHDLGALPAWRSPLGRWRTSLPC